MAQPSALVGRLVLAISAGSANRCSLRRGACRTGEAATGISPAPQLPERTSCSALRGRSSTA
eukprot:5832772-Pyramimonas_sp.AAC.1